MFIDMQINGKKKKQRVLIGYDHATSQKYVICYGNAKGLGVEEVQPRV